jgi:DNA-binding GntR family transcriptional regulator
MNANRERPARPLSVTKTSVLGPSTRAEAAANEIRRRILAGHYVGGQPLRQDLLAEELGVSRVPVREALVLREAEGLIRIHPHRGAVVAALSVEDIEELVRLRVMLEPMLLRQSAPYLTAEDFQALDRILAEYTGDLDANSIESFGKRNTDLHGVLYQRANSPRTESIVTTLLQANDRYARMQISYTAGQETADREHREIVELCRVGDIDAACRHLADHIQAAGDALIEFIRQRSPTQLV